MDFLWALIFFLWYEVLSLPLRTALSSTAASADVRRVLSRVAGPLMLTLPIWLAGHAAGWTLGRGFGLAWLGAGLLATFCLWGRRERTGRLLAYHDGHAAGAAAGRELRLDALTLALFLAFVAVRRWVPEMTAYPIDNSAAEKFMNVMFFWSNWHAPSLPPEDYWLSGHRLTYYYWGHFHWAWIGRTGGFPVELALNLGFCRLVTLVFEASYLLARAIGLGIGWSMGSGIAAAWAGNPSAVGEMWRVWQASPSGYVWGAYNFWKPSRAMADSVIDEFPAFSAILGDFHAHHHALPWVVAWAAVTLAAGRWLPLAGKQGGWASRLRPALASVPWLCLGVAAALANVWNLPVMGGVMALALLASLRRGPRFASAVLVAQVCLGLLAVAGVQLLLGADTQPLPVDPGASLLERLPVKWLPAELRSTLPQLFAMWGLPAAVLAGAAAVRSLTSWHRRAIGVTLLGWGLLFGGAGLGGLPLPGGSFWLWAAVGCWIAALAMEPAPWISRRAVWMLVAAVGVVAGSELLFVDDAMIGEYERYNSYFKLTYPVWPALVAGAFAAAHGIWGWRARAALARVCMWTARVGLLTAVAASAIYPLCAIPARLVAARRGDDPPRTPTLNAVDFLAHRPPWAEEAPMLAWIRAHVPPGEVVAEGLGKGAYGYVGRVASLSGRPVPLGWSHHEGQWRGLAGHRLTAERKDAIDRLYRADTPEQMRTEAAKLGVSWVVYGLVERERYGDPRGEEPVLRMLKRTAPLAAAFPADRPTVFLFDFRALPR